jgi:hypothetical protein
MHTPGTAHPRRWWILVALCFSLLVLVIDNTILNLAIPALMSELRATPADIQASWRTGAHDMFPTGTPRSAASVSPWRPPSATRETTGRRIRQLTRPSRSGE